MNAPREPVPLELATAEDLQRLADQYQRDAIAEAQAMRPDDETAEDLG
jgi:hypothetical protein